MTDYNESTSFREALGFICAQDDLSNLLRHHRKLSSMYDTFHDTGLKHQPS